MSRAKAVQQSKDRLVANMLVKAPTAWALGGTAYGVRVGFGAVLLSAGLIAGAAVAGLLAG